MIWCWVHLVNIKTVVLVNDSVVCYYYYYNYNRFQSLLFTMKNFERTTFYECACRFIRLLCASAAYTRIKTASPHLTTFHYHAVRLVKLLFIFRFALSQLLGTASFLTCTWANFFCQHIVYKSSREPLYTFKDEKYL